MPDWDTVLFIVVVAGLAIVLAGGALQWWRDWVYDRRIRKHLRK